MQSRSKKEDEYRCGAKVWFTPFMGTKKLQPISIDLVIDEVQGLEPEVLAPIDRLNIEGPQSATIEYAEWRAPLQINCSQ